MTHSITTDQLETLISFNAPVQIIDVRKTPAFEADSAVVKGAKWCDPFAVKDWAGQLDSEKAVICYCVHGHEVSQNAMQELRDRGFDAYYVRGGMDAWKKVSGPLQSKG